MRLFVHFCAQKFEYREKMENFCAGEKKYIYVSSKYLEQKLIQTRIHVPPPYIDVHIPRLVLYHCSQNFLYYRSENEEERLLAILE